MENLEQIGTEILGRLEVKATCRETVLGHSRHLVQHAARSIRATHRGEWEGATALLQEAKALLDTMVDAADGHSDIESAGYMLDAQKEYAEAHLTLALVKGEDLPAPKELGVEDAAWLNGLGEAAGELRRASLDHIRQGEIAAAETLLGRMQEIHTFISSVDFPAAITRNVKRTNDMVRGVTERTRGDLTIAARQEGLEAALRRFEARMTGDGEPG